MPDETIRLELTVKQTAAVCAGLKMLAADHQRKGGSAKTPPSKRRAFRDTADGLVTMATAIAEAAREQQGAKVAEVVIVDFGRETERDMERAVFAGAIAALPALITDAIGRDDLNDHAAMVFAVNAAHTHGRALADLFKRDREEAS